MSKPLPGLETGNLFGVALVGRVHIIMTSHPLLPYAPYNDAYTGSKL